MPILDVYVTIGGIDQLIRSFEVPDDEVSEAITRQEALIEGCFCKIQMPEVEAQKLRWEQKNRKEIQK